MSLNLSNDDLEIHLAAPEGWTFAPGDPVIGTIVRRSPLVTPEANISLALKRELKLPQVLFKTLLLDSRKQGIFRGPLHVNGREEVASWPFEARIPYSQWTSNGEVTEESDEPPSYDGEKYQELPGSFRIPGARSSLVRYYIEAEIRYILGGSLKKSTTGLELQLKIPQRPFEGFGSQHGKVAGMVESHHLLDGKKRKSLFSIAQAGQYHFQVEILAPKVVQLNNREPFPLKFRVHTLDRTKSPIRENPPVVMLTSFKMNLNSSTYIRFPREHQELSQYTPGSTFYTYRLGVEDAFKKMSSDSGLRLPSGEKEDYLDIGDLLQLTFYPNGLMAGRVYLRREVLIVPDMTAVFVKHNHTLQLEFSLKIIGKVIECNWDCPIEII